MEATSTPSWNITMMLMINVMLVLLVHVVQPLPQGRIYFPEFSPPSPPPPPPQSPNPYHTRICYESCSYECRGEMSKDNSPNPSPNPPDLPDQPKIPPMGCGGYCYLRCSEQMPPNLYQCTAGCAYNFMTTTTPTQSNDDSGM